MPAIIYFLFAEEGSSDLGRVEIPFPSDISIASALELANAFADLMAPLTYGGIVKAGVSYELDLGIGAHSPTNALADLRDKARFAFRAVGAAGNFAKLMTLPTYDESYTVPGTKSLDLTDPDVDAFVDAMVNGVAVTAGTIQPVDSREYPITALEYAVEL